MGNVMPAMNVKYFFPIVLLVISTQIFSPVFGQNNTGKVWETIGPYGSDYNTKLIINPTDANKIYALGNSTLYLSSDKGNSWLNVSPQEYPGGSITDIVFSENSSSKIFAITGNKQTVITSTDYGENWKLLYTDAVHQIEYIDKSNPDHLIGYKTSGAWGNYFRTIKQTTDGGKTWQETTNGINVNIGPLTAYINPYNPQIMFANQTISYGGDILMGSYVFASKDGGYNWEKLDVDSTRTSYRPIFYPGNTNTVYLLVSRDSLFKTTDFGKNWFSVGKGFPWNNFSDLYFSPSNPEVMYACTNDELPSEECYIFNSTDGGLDWHLFRTISGVQHISSFVINPTDENEWFVSAYPVGVLHSIDGGHTWNNKSKGLSLSYVVSISAYNSKIIYAGVSNVGFVNTTDGGNTWNNIFKELSTSPGKILVSKNNSEIAFCTGWNGETNFNVSYDAGQNWQFITTPHQWDLHVFDVAYDNKTIYGDAYIGSINSLSISSIMKSSDCGLNWETFELGLDDVNYFDNIKVDPQDKDIVYAEAALRGGINRNVLIKTSDGGDTWRIIADSVYNFFINHTDTKYLYCSKKDKFLISSDKGENFSEIPSTEDFEYLVSNPVSEGVLYALLFGGTMAVSNDYGFTWNPIEKLSANKDIKEMEICLDENGKLVLLGSTRYTGILKCELDNITSVTQGLAEASPLKYKLLQNYPNPFNPKSNIKYQIAKTGYVKLTIYDVLGNKVSELVNDFQTPGIYDVVFDASSVGGGLTSGIYFCHLQANEYSQTLKLMLVK